ncbi:DUF1772 domain-containing protein [Rhodococcus chondri]|uniref:DUF1772 domain-containing protein n=1 Tax=Rhodococcus chondri TaxID=3065941 RepID=A0ABU7JNB0_9NOCA|nr:DUF1772 domain-containing protein [Rhodococcus sp. CC-R104]MEE2031374.1 DUF1772 domain-containing protein [Rhodococcus sp. CC-R104]
MSSSHPYAPRTVVAVAYSWITLIAFGGILAETIILYPNIFHDAPASLEEADRFFSQAGPGDYFRPLGAATVVLAVATVVLLRHHRAARLWAAASLCTLVAGEFAFSALYFWPRNTIMFDEGPAVHSVEVLRQTAAEFETGHWVRMAVSGVTAVLAFVALFRLMQNPQFRDERPAPSSNLTDVASPPRR